MTNRNPTDSDGSPEDEDRSAPSETLGFLFWLSRLATDRSCSTNGDAAPAFKSPRAFGHFRLEALLGTGSYGAVFRATDVELDRKVAVKIAWPATLMDAETSRRFIEEPKTVASLKHPGIVEVYSSGNVEMARFIALELVEGPTLADWLKSQDRVSIRTAVQICRSVAEAVDYAHGASVVHRDLKPRNILFRPISATNGNLPFRPVVTDFGLASRARLVDATAVTATHAVLGTDYYMSPEQAAGRSCDVSAPADVFSLGVILYEIIAGRRPFDGETVQETRSLIQEDDPPSMRLWRKDIPVELEAIALKCLEKTPSRRYQSAGELAADLCRFLAGEPTLARPARAWQRGLKIVRRRPMAVALAGATIITALLVSGLASMLVAQQRDVHASQAIAQLERQESQRHARDAQVQSERGQWARYAEQIARAQDAWDTNNVKAAWDALAASPERMRGWEYQYLYSQFSASEILLQAPNEPAVVSPDGRLAAGYSIRSNDAVVAGHVWDTSEGHEAFTFTPAAHGNIVFGQDGQLVAIHNQDGIECWSVENRRPVSRIPCDRSDFVLSPDNSRLAVVEEAGVTLWNTADGTKLRDLLIDGLRFGTVAFSPDGRRLAGTIWNQNSIAIWNLEEIDKPVIHNVADRYFHQVAFSPDGNSLAAYGNSAMTLIDANSGVQIWQMKRQINGFTFEPTGRRIAVSETTGAISICDAANGQTVFVLRGHDNRATSTAFADGGRVLVSCGNDKTLRRWDLYQSQYPRTVGADESGNVGATSVVFSRDGQRIISDSGDNTAMEWDLASGKKMSTFKGHRDNTLCVAVSPDDRLIATGSYDKTVKIWNAREQSELRTLTGHQNWVTSVAFSPDGERLASASRDKKLLIWDVDKGQLVQTLQGHSEPVNIVAYFPDGQRVASGADDNTVKVWDIATGTATRTLTNKGQVKSVSISPDGRLIAAGNDLGWVTIWDADSGDEVVHVRCHHDAVTSIVFSPDGLRLATASFDATVRLWKPDSGQQLLVLRAPDYLETLAFSLDGRRLVCAGENVPITIWDAEKASRPDVLSGHPNLTSK